ncbi:Uncharacterised protein [Mycobacterium tuberculosis]|nr:Uncharacterised protein [Mycobacterium tuberculosis]
MRRCCQISVENPKAAPSDITIVPTMTPAATKARVTITMMMKMSTIEATAAIIRSNLAPVAMSWNVAAVPPR